MPRRRILVASPVEPSGASWLLNCFLELGIQVDHKPVVDRMWRGSSGAGRGLPPDAGHMWIPQDDHRVALHPKAGVLMKFLPALARHAAFRFRDDVEVTYVQDFPPRRLGANPAHECSRVLFVRDPRDALYSSYRRSAPSLNFTEYLHFPNPDTLLDRSAHWTLFIAAWLAHPDIHVVRFEDYKRDAEATLSAVLAALDLSYADRDVAGAVRLSSFESARDAEASVRDRFPHDRQVANRSGTVGEGRDHPEMQASIAEIEGATATVFRELGYAASAPDARDGFAAARLSAAFLAFFDTVQLPAAMSSVPLDMAASQEILFTLLAFAYRLDADFLGRAGMAPAEARALLDSLAELTRRHAEWLADRLVATRSTFLDGSGYFFQRVREMRQSGKSTTRP